MVGAFNREREWSGAAAIVGYAAGGAIAGLRKQRRRARKGGR
jgi:hypothetical protein